MSLVAKADCSGCQFPCVEKKERSHVQTSISLTPNNGTEFQQNDHTWPQSLPGCAGVEAKAPSVLNLPKSPGLKMVTGGAMQTAKGGKQPTVWPAVPPWTTERGSGRGKTVRPKDQEIHCWLCLLEMRVTLHSGHLYNMVSLNKPWIRTPTDALKRRLRGCSPGQILQGTRGCWGGEKQSSTMEEPPNWLSNTNGSSWNHTHVMLSGLSRLYLCIYAYMYIQHMYMWCMYHVYIYQ